MSGINTLNNNPSNNPIHKQAINASRTQGSLLNSNKRDSDIMSAVFSLEATQCLLSYCNADKPVSGYTPEVREYLDLATSNYNQFAFVAIAEDAAFMCDVETGDVGIHSIDHAMELYIHGHMSATALACESVRYLNVQRQLHEQYITLDKEIILGHFILGLPEIKSHSVYRVIDMLHEWKTETYFAFDEQATTDHNNLLEVINLEPEQYSQFTRVVTKQLELAV